MDSELRQVRIIGVSKYTNELLEAKQELDRFYNHISDLDHGEYEDEFCKLFVNMNDSVMDMIAAQVCMNSSESDYMII